MRHVSAISLHVSALLEGATDPDPSLHGLTTDEERSMCHMPQARPMHLAHPPPPTPVVCTARQNADGFPWTRFGLCVALRRKGAHCSRILARGAE
jgi:hypothetical protein